MDTQWVVILVLLAVLVLPLCAQYFEKNWESLERDGYGESPHNITLSTVVNRHFTKNSNISVSVSEQIVRDAENYGNMTSSENSDLGKDTSSGKRSARKWSARKCPPGYVNGGRFRKCKPVCALGCLHGKCVAPNTCKCHMGYVWDRMYTHKCLPACHLPCKNAKCVKPNKCACHPGYKPDPFLSSRCLPICEPNCVGGTCIAPSHCKCLGGFVPMGHNFCGRVPIPADHGHVQNNTIANDVANHHNAFANGIAVHKGVANIPGHPVHPHASLCSQPCVGGHCVGPDTCQCKHGYSQRSRFECGPPRCSRPCINSTCVMDNYCSCFDGYNKSNSDPFACVPLCSKPCRGGTCVAPEWCACLKRYVRINKYECTFVHCDRPCRNATCVARNDCACNPGYEKSPSDSFSCRPFCSHPCKGGVCSAPETCQCTGSFVKKSKYECGPPHCRRPCINATCTDNDFCTCLPNYKKAVGDSFRCEPVCSPACGANATCHSPNHCECLGGFVRSPSGRCERPSPAGGCSSGFARVGGKCVPVCTGGCVNGVCTAPNRCLCNAGFIKHKMSNVCVGNAG